MMHYFYVKNQDTVIGIPQCTLQQKQYQQHENTKSN